MQAKMSTVIFKKSQKSFGGEGGVRFPFTLPRTIRLAGGPRAPLVLFSILVPQEGLEPPRLSAIDFESTVAAVTPLRHYWCGWRDSNPHAFALVPKTSVATDYTTSA